MTAGETDVAALPPPYIKHHFGPIWWGPASQPATHAAQSLFPFSFVSLGLDIYKSNESRIQRGVDPGRRKKEKERKKNADPKELCSCV